MIDIAIVTTAIRPRKTARRDNDEDATETRTGSIWIKRGDKVRRKTIESVTAAGIRLELMAFFERYLGRTFRLQIVEPIYADRKVAPAVVELAAAPVFCAPHGFKQFVRSKFKREGFSPFSYGHVGELHVGFRPPWYVEPEPPILLRSSAGDGFTYPASDDTSDTKESDDK